MSGENAVNSRIKCTGNLEETEDEAKVSALHWVKHVRSENVLKKADGSLFDSGIDCVLSYSDVSLFLLERRAEGEVAG